jgi:aminoglycoside 6'-N-acetyltransferase I
MPSDTANTIVDAHTLAQPHLDDLARILKAGLPLGWPDIAGARREVEASLVAGAISRAALDNEGRVLGWAAGRPQYDGHVWELHPLVVNPPDQGRGVGTALVGDFEAQVRWRGGITVLLGCDDEDNSTTLGGADLYPGVLARLQQVRSIRRHPITFYARLGYAVVGVIPDANGFGKPDILMAKRVGGSA